MMKPLFPLAVAASATLLGSVNAYAIEMTDYIEPTISTEEAYVSASLSGISGNNKDSANGQAQVQYDRGYESRERTMSFEAKGNYSDTSRSDSIYDATIAADINSYLSGKPNLFWFGSASGFTDNLDANSDYADLLGGIGYGRVTTATPLARALRVVEELQQHNVVTVNVSDSAYLRLAQILAKQQEYRSKYGAEEYLAEFVGAVEKVMIETGMISGQLNAMGSTYLQQVLSEAYDVVQTRAYGWWARGGAGVRVDEKGDSTDPAITLEFKYAKPIALNAQFTNTAKYSAIFTDGSTVGQNISNNMEYVYEIGDKIDWLNTWLLNIDIADSTASGDLISNRLSSTFRYYLTNRLTLDATIAAAQVSDDIDNNGNDDAELSSLLSVRYRLR